MAAFLRPSSPLKKRGESHITLGKPASALASMLARSLARHSSCSDFETFYFDKNWTGLERVEFPTYGWSLEPDQAIAGWLNL